MALTGVKRAAYESLKGRTNATYEDFCDLVKTFDIHPIMLDNEPIGALIIKGPEIHACVLSIGKGRWMNKRILRLINSVVANHGFAQTSATTDEGVAFVKRLGFVQENEKWVLNHFCH